MKAQVHVVISGKVTGVFFRSALRNEARIRQVGGWVRNAPSGQVEAVLEGDKDRVTDLIEFCKRGPATASVGDVTVEWAEAEGHFTDFEIR